MITCPKCSKENQDHYKFCLGCGAELPRDAAPKPFAPRTPPQGMKAVQAKAATGPQPGLAAPPAAPRPAPVSPPVVDVAPAAQPVPPPPPPAPAAVAPVAVPVPVPVAAVAVPTPAPAPVPSDGEVICPQCDHVNAAGHKFCASCGFALVKTAAAPAPAVAPAAAASGARLTALRADGSEAGTYDVPAGTTTLG